MHPSLSVYGLLNRKFIHYKNDLRCYTSDSSRIPVGSLALGRDYAANYQGDIFIKTQIRKFVADVIFTHRVAFQHHEQHGPVLALNQLHLGRR